MCSNCGYDDVYEETTDWNAKEFTNEELGIKPIRGWGAASFWTGVVIFAGFCYWAAWQLLAPLVSKL